MNAFFDTSVLVATFIGEHMHYKKSFDCFIVQNPATGCCGAHSLAEVYSTLTRLPGKHRIIAAQALSIIDSIGKQLSIISLTSDEYATALTSSAALGITGGTIYDVLLACCAIKANAKMIYTWNLRHYAQCGSDVTARLRTP